MSKVHIVMPFSRKDMLPKLLKIYGKNPLHLLMFENQYVDWDAEWAKPIIVNPCPPSEDYCYYKINQFIKTQKIEDNDYYWCMCDDDSIESNVISKLKKMKDDVVFISMKRGYQIPAACKYQHPTTTLIAKPENVRVNVFGIQQMVVKGKIFKTLKFDTQKSNADGWMGIYLKEHYPVHYEPDLFVLFNYFEPGRWDKPEVKQPEKKNGITCITCTGDRQVAFDLCQRWMNHQTVKPDQWIIIDDGKVPTEVWDLPWTPKQVDYVRREPKSNDPAHTLILNLKEALPKVKGDKIMFIEDDEYYAPTYIEEMSKRLEDHELVGICQSKYYHIAVAKWFRDNNKDQASLAQTAFRKSMLKFVTTSLKGNQFVDLRIWTYSGKKSLFVDEPSLYCGIKGLPGRPGIGQGHDVTMQGYKTDIGLNMIKAWIPGNYQYYLSLNNKNFNLSKSSGTYQANTRGYIKGIGLIMPGEIFDYDGPKGSWMKPVERRTYANVHREREGLSERSGSY